MSTPLTELVTAAPSYSALFAEGLFSQRRMINGRELREAGGNRGLDLPLFPRRDLLEPLDRSGGFSPIGFLQTNFTPETTWLSPDPDLLVWREERHFHDWDSHGWFLHDEPYVNVSERYSPWQLLYLAEAMELARPVLPLQRGRDVGARNLAADEARAAAVRLQTLDEAWRPLIKLLIALQTRLWPYRRQRTTFVHAPEVQEAIDPLRRAAQDFNPLMVASRFELRLEQLAEIHWQLGEFGRRLDPIPRWYSLAEVAPRRVTDEFRGARLRAHDFYDAAYLLRGLYYLATGDWLPQADELDHPAVDYRRRHLPHPKYAGPRRRVDLKDLLLREGLYPHRIHFFVEGTTEKVVLERLLPFLGYPLPESGMALTDIRGVDQLERYAVLFRSATLVSARTVLIADLEGTLPKLLKRLQQEGLFAEPEDVLLWSKDGHSIDFEEANFTEREILTAIQRVARMRAPDVGLKLTVAELRRLRDEQTRSRRPPPALAKTALQLAEARGVRVSKPELAAALAEKIVSEIRLAGHLADVGERRPLAARLWHWLVTDR